VLWTAYGPPEVLQLGERRGSLTPSKASCNPDAGAPSPPLPTVTRARSGALPVSTRHHGTRAPLRADVNVTPMIDVMLVLLIIFMLVTPLIHSMSVLPRSAHAESRPEDPDDITLDIDRQGSLFLATSPREGPVLLTPELLAARLTALYRNRVLYLKADSRVDFGRIDQAIAIARRAGVRVVAAVTEPRGTGGRP
jgi:biopolymer transport protein TolR